tara:strand:+ start:117 stop:383 length:267 start_codon:yes stop_codon:yes gene_type:complete
MLDYDFERDALLHEIQDKIDNFYKNNIVIPLFWREENGKKIYDLELMQKLWDDRMEALWGSKSKSEPNNWEDYQCGNDEAPRKEEGEF